MQNKNKFNFNNLNINRFTIICNLEYTQILIIIFLVKEKFGPPKDKDEDDIDFYEPS